LLQPRFPRYNTTNLTYPHAIAFFISSVLLAVGTMYSIYKAESYEIASEADALLSSETTKEKAEPTYVLLEVVSSEGNSKEISGDVNTSAEKEEPRDEELNTIKKTVELEPEKFHIIEEVKEKKETVRLSNNLKVPFYSQFTDITSPSRKKIGCGVASLAMLIELYVPGEKVSVDNLFDDGLKAGAYLNDAGWIHSGLINLSKKYGLNGKSHGLNHLSKNSAFEKLRTVLEDGPVIASVHYTFDPKNPIPHLVVINSTDGNTVYYNDPAEKTGGNSISKDKFIKAWKKRYIEIRPV